MLQTSGVDIILDRAGSDREETHWPRGCEFQQVEDLLKPVSAKAVSDEMVVFGLRPRSGPVAASNGL